MKKLLVLLFVASQFLVLTTGFSQSKKENQRII
jgi:hypothetical protein